MKATAVKTPMGIVFGISRTDEKIIELLRKLSQDLLQDADMHTGITIEVQIVPASENLPASTVSGE